MNTIRHAFMINLLLSLTLVSLIPASWQAHAGGNPLATEARENGTVNEKSEQASTSHKDDFRPIQGYEAEFRLKSKKYKLSTKATRKLVIKDNQQATLSQNASVTFVASINQTSNFTTSKQSCNIQSDTYDYRRSVFGKKKHYRIEFDHDRKIFTEQEDNSVEEHAINNDLFDELSYQEALRCELKNIKTLVPGTQFTYQLRTKGRNKSYTFEVIGEEKLETALGELDTVKLSRIRSSRDKDDQTNIWFSKQHAFMLVQLSQEDEDDKLSLEIIKLKQP